MKPLPLTLTYYTDDYDIFPVKILGFIDRSQFYKLFTDPEKFTRKVGSGEVKSIKTISKVRDYRNQRLVLSTEIDGNRKLLVTGEIIEKNTVKIGKYLALNMVDSSHNFIYLEENDVSF